MAGKKFVPFEEQFGPSPNPGVPVSRVGPKKKVSVGRGKRGPEVSSRMKVGRATVTPSVAFGNVFQKDARTKDRLTPTGGGVEVTIPFGGRRKK